MWRRFGEEAQSLKSPGMCSLAADSCASDRRVHLGRGMEMWKGQGRTRIVLILAKRVLFSKDKYAAAVIIVVVTHEATAGTAPSPC